MQHQVRGGGVGQGLSEMFGGGGGETDTREGVDTDILGMAISP